jgi:hypothetical protein
MRTALLAIVTVVVPGCGLLGKTVSEDDCTKWDKHFREAMQESAEKALNKCKDDNAAAKGYLKNLEENISNTADGIASGCHSVVKLGTYTKDEEKCFMGSSDPAAWGKCELKSTSAIKLYTNSGDNMFKTISGFCKGSDDEDAPKKKKKKKAKEDDE